MRRFIPLGGSAVLMAVAVMLAAAAIGARPPENKNLLLPIGRGVNVLLRDSQSTSHGKLIAADDEWLVLETTAPTAKLEWINRRHVRSIISYGARADHEAAEQRRDDEEVKQLHEH